MTQPHAHAETPHDPGEAMFLTPRVIDRRTFEEYSGLLRELIREAAGESRTLRNAAGEVRSMQEGLERAAAELAGRLDAVLKVMPLLEHRITRMEQLMAATSDAPRLQEEVSRHIAAATRSVCDETVAALRRQADRIVEDLAGDLARAAREAHAGIDAARQESGRQVENLLREAKQTIESACADARRRVADAARECGIGADHVMEQWRAAEASLARRAAELEAGLGHAAAQAHELALRETSRSRAELHKAVEDATRHADQLLSDLDARLDKVHQWASRVVAEVEERLDAWSRRTAQITAELGPEALETVRNLPALIEQARKERLDLDEAIRAGADRIEGQSAALERLAARQEELSAAINAALSRAQPGTPRRRTRPTE